MTSFTFYQGLPHVIVESRSQFTRIYGKDWSRSDIIPTSGVYYHLRCVHPDPCRDLEYVKRVRTFTKDDSVVDADELKCAWISESLCSYGIEPATTQST